MNIYKTIVFAFLAVLIVALALLAGNAGTVLLAFAAWALAALAFVPILRLYRVSVAWAPALPFAALLYALMTVDSARRHMQGRGGAWKGRMMAGSRR